MVNETGSISADEVAAMDKEVNAKLAEEATKNNESLAKKIREEVEKEFRQKQEFEKLQTDQKRMSEELKKAQEEAVKARADAEKRTNELEAAFKKQLEEALVEKRGRGVVGTGGSPFDNQHQTLNANQRRLSDGRVIDVSTMTKEEARAIEVESMNQFYINVLGRPPPPSI
jgi:hypothetical protein